MDGHELSISVAMCTYNGAAYLPEQLESIARQSRLPNEMVICDDGSSDSTPELLADFAANAPFTVRVYRNQTNLGSTKNFEQAISLCTGDLIALSDQDDIWMPNKLALQSKRFEQDPDLGGLFTDARLIDHDSHCTGDFLWSTLSFTAREQEAFKTGSGASILLHRSVVTGATLMIRSNTRKLFMPISNKWVHDGWIAWMLSVCSKLHPLADPLISYRLHANQQCGVGEGPRSFWKRLTQVSRSGPREYIALAREYEEVEMHLARLDGFERNTVLAALHQKSTLLYARASLPKTFFSRLRFITANLRSYRRYFPLRSVFKDMWGRNCEWR